MGTGYLAIFITVQPEASNVTGAASGRIRFTIVSPAGEGESSERRSLVEMPLTVNIIPTPPRQLRVLWDQFHSIKYPPGFVPRDNMDAKNDGLDWHGDHLHTNYRQVRGSSGSGSQLAGKALT